MEIRSAREIWGVALGELQVQVSRSNYRTWLEKTEGLEYQNGCFIVSVPNTFIAEYLDRNQRSLIEKTLIHLTASPEIQVSFQVNGRYHNSSNGHKSDPGTLISALSASTQYNPKYIFDNFIVGDCNRLAYAAAQGIAMNPGKIYNPLYIYGGFGLGKTHLLHAIAHVAQSKHIQAICISAEQFTNEFVSAVRQKKIDDFHLKYRHAGMLLIDDIHFISGKKQTEESFFHTFNSLHNANRQIVITSDRPPKAITLLDKRLRSRFEWGLVADIQPPDRQTIRTILQSKALQKEIDIASEVLDFLASQVPQNIRELEGLLNRVTAFAKLFNSPPSLNLAEKAIADIGSRERTFDLSTQSLVINAVAHSFDMKPEDLKGSKRDKETSLARRIAMYLLRQETACSLAQIGALLGNRDPSSVTNACKKFSAELNSNKSLKHQLADIQKIINPPLK
ncbi:MAG TPA: chromosomal replication initiator protein DnaA [Dehalococcoidia bacterium]|nr:chromosomal replication initiator protein DnaA [Dehalococcoidia bacterium]